MGGIIKAVGRFICSRIGIIVIAVLVILLIGYFLFGRGGGTGNGNGDGKGEGNTSVENPKEKEENPKNDTLKKKNDERKNADDYYSDEFKGAIEEITVSESDYYYKNERISLDDFISALYKIDGELVVEITDDNASLNAYDSLVKRLKEEHIDYVEKE